jgi:hypothetical protein
VNDDVTQHVSLAGASAHPDTIIHKSSQSKALVPTIGARVGLVSH